MTTRTTQTLIHFSSPFMLPGLDRPLPAGDYIVDQDEELIEGIYLVAWRRTGSFIHLPAIGQVASTEQLVAVKPAELDAALLKDNRI